MKTVNYYGKQLTLTSPATYQGEYYSTWAEDEEGNKYEVRWEVTAENPEQVVDESEMCNWDEYKIRKT